MYKIYCVSVLRPIRSVGQSSKAMEIAPKLIENDLEIIRNELNKYQGGSVHVEKNEENGVAVISLDHQEKRNAMSGAMMVQLRECVLSLETWKNGKAVILCGKGSNFCSGGDLNFARAANTPQHGLNMSIWMQDVLNRLHKLPLISVCLIQGPTLGGGAELSVCCDFIVAANDVKYGFVHGRMGIVPAWGGAFRLIQKVGRVKAFDLLLTSKILNAQGCLEVGIAQHVVSSEHVMKETMEWLRPRIQHHFSVVQALKSMILNSYDVNKDSLLKQEMHIFAPFWGGTINRDALQKNIKH